MKSALRGWPLVVVATAYTPAWSAEKNDLHVLRVFTEGTATAGFMPVENIAGDCHWNIMYLDLSQPAGRGQLALLMQAKAQGLKLQRVDYLRDASGLCSISGLHVE